MTLLVRNIIVSIALAVSDFISFVISLYLAIGILSITVSDYQTIISANQLEGWKLLHWLLALCCVAWYSMRLRHYFYRKTFWFELKEILRTLVIFAVIEIAILAFANWSFSRFLWGLTWVFVLLLVPLARMVTKRVLDVFGLWHRETWIIGSGANAQEAYKAINSERNLGLVIVGFIATTAEASDNKNIDGIPVLTNDPVWLSSMDKKTQFIVAVESHQSDIRNAWLRNFMIKGYRYISVIPTLRGMPLDSTDMSFIFSRQRTMIAKINFKFSVAKR